jgi:hypothetical protein
MPVFSMTAADHLQDLVGVDSVRDQLLELAIQGRHAAAARGCKGEEMSVAVDPVSAYRP